MHNSSIKLLQDGCVIEKGAIQDLKVTVVDGVMIKVLKLLEHISHLLLVCLSIACTFPHPFPHIPPRNEEGS